MAANYILIERIELNQSASSVTFSNIPQTGYTDLKIVISGRTDCADVVDTVAMTFNANTSSYTWRELYGNGGTAGSASGSTRRTTFTNGNNNTASTFGNSEIYIPNYTTANYKSYSADGVSETNAATAWMALDAGLWSNTAAITSIGLSPISGTTWLTGSTFSLYGIANASTTPAVAPKADGGNIIATDGTYWYHAFLSNGTFTPQVGLSCDYLVVAGGGGGGFWQNSGGGGGAGGLRSATSQTLTATNYTVTVGAGGSGGAYQTAGTKGTNSSFNSLSSTGGGGGGSGHGSSAGNATTGGSGGGGWAIDGTNYGLTGAAGNQGGYSPVEGYAGGDATVNNGFGSSGGGGGAGGIGNNGSGNAGNGGVGSSTYSSWGLATTTGQNVSGTVYYAGGGGGGRDIRGGGSSGEGGSGGGGRGGGGSANRSPVNGTANTGGGGGGGGNDGGFTQASGGSGIVIVRYLAA